ncbi:hypothetical protein L2E82_22754 [Cichorium intybus]|uniref:Uncharacterized protein n=1 Tax=Cichorium intybus TaxID=13427 RepID=A0ACB9DZ01_CICIN|nr:hypothetical protein L2E82_22754 [Cichorium intybus]
MFPVFLTDINEIEIRFSIGRFKLNSDNLNIKVCTNFLNSFEIGVIFARRVSNGRSEGFEEGIRDMKPGGKRRIIIPPELGPPVS